MAVAGRAARVDQQHPHALAREHLELGEEDVAVVPVRAAVDVQDQGVAPSRAVAIGAHQPCFDPLVGHAREPEGVRGDRHEPRHERVVERGEPPLPIWAACGEGGEEELQRMREVAPRVGERAAVAAQIEPAELALAGRHLAHRAAGGGDGEQMNAAARLGGEVQGAAVRCPERALGIQVPGEREVADGPACGGYHAHVVLFAPALGTDEGDGLAVGRPGGVVILHVGRRERSRGTVGERQHVEPGPNLRPQLRGFGRVLHIGDGPAVGRPGGVDLTQRTAGELLRLAAGEGYDVEVSRPSQFPGCDEAALVFDQRQRGVHAAVEAFRVRPAGDGERRDAGAPRLLFRAVGLSAAPAVQQGLPVGGEQGQRVDAANLERLAARRPGSQKPHVVVKALAVALEGDEGAVGRPHGVGRLRGGARIAERSARALRRRHPDLGVAPILVLDDRRHREGHAPAVGRQAWLSHHRQAVIVDGLKRVRWRLGGEGGGRSSSEEGTGDEQPTGCGHA